MKKSKISRNFICPCVCLILVIWIPFGCRSLQSQIQGLTHKDDDASTQQDNSSSKTEATSPAESSAESEEVNQGFVVNIKNYLPAKAGPARGTKTLGNFFLGDKVTIEKEQGRWLYVTRQDVASPLEGWVVNKYIDNLTIMEQDAESLIQLSYIRKTDYKPDKIKINRMKFRTTAQGAAIGAAKGAVIGGVTALITGKDVKKGAVIGAAGGMVVGVATGFYIANEKEKYATEEAYLDACIVEAREYNDAAKDHNVRLERAIAATEKEISVLKNKIKNNYSRRTRAQNDIVAMKNISKDTDYVIEILEGQIEAQKTTYKEVEHDAALLKALEREIEETKTQIINLKKQRDRLTTLIGEMSKQTV